MVCSFCQEIIDDRSAVCIHCGMRVDRTVSVKPVPVTVKPDKPAVPVPEPVKEVPKPIVPESEVPAAEPEITAALPEEPVLEPETPVSETILPPPEPTITASEPEVSVPKPEVPMPKSEIKFDMDSVRSGRSVPRSAPVDIQPVKKSKAAAVFSGFLIVVLVGLIVLILGGAGLLVAFGFLTGKEDSAPVNSNYTTDTSNDQTTLFVLNGQDCNYCYHIPEVNLQCVNASKINEEMYKTHYAHLEEMVFANEEQPFMLQMTYSVHQKGDIVSVMVQEFCDADITTYYVYNFSASTGEEIRDEAVFSEFGLSESEGREIIKESLALYWDKYYEEMGNEYRNEFAEEVIGKTLSDSNIRLCRPFIDKDGNLRYTGSIYSLGGADCYDWIFDNDGNIWREHCNQHS